MKKTTIIYLLAACSGYLILTSYSGGAGSHGWDCTGAETGLSNPAGCSSGGGCHATSATATITVALELDSVGIPTTHYKGGLSYTVKLSGTNTSATSLPGFGLQIGAIKGSVALTTPVNAGTWMAPFPASTTYAAPSPGNFVVGVVEQTGRIAATSGTGGAGTTYVKTFNWTAPVAGTGTISFWAVLNAVNANASADTGDKWNLIHKTITEWPATTTGISEYTGNQFSMNLYPNPAVNNVNLSYTLTKSSAVSVQIFDINGKLSQELLNETQGEGEQKLSSSISLSKGIYSVVLSVDGAKSIKKLIIQ